MICCLHSTIGLRDLQVIVTCFYLHSTQHLSFLGIGVGALFFIFSVCIYSVLFLISAFI